MNLRTVFGSYFNLCKHNCKTLLFCFCFRYLRGISSAASSAQYQFLCIRRAYRQTIAARQAIPCKLLHQLNVSCEKEGTCSLQVFKMVAFSMFSKIEGYFLGNFSLRSNVCHQSIQPMMYIVKYAVRERIWWKIITIEYEPIESRYNTFVGKQKFSLVNTKDFMEKGNFSQ